jgi:hypothetical protein
VGGRRGRRGIRRITMPDVRPGLVCANRRNFDRHGYVSQSKAFVNERDCMGMGKMLGTLKEEQNRDEQEKGDCVPPIGVERYVRAPTSLLPALQVALLRRRIGQAEQSAIYQNSFLNSLQRLRMAGHMHLLEIAQISRGWMDARRPLRP